MVLKIPLKSINQLSNYLGGVITHSILFKTPGKPLGVVILRKGEFNELFMYLVDMNSLIPLGYDFLGIREVTSIKGVDMHGVYVKYSDTSIGFTPLSFLYSWVALHNDQSLRGLIPSNEERARYKEYMRRLLNLYVMLGYLNSTTWIGKALSQDEVLLLSGIRDGIESRLIELEKDYYGV